MIHRKIFVNINDTIDKEKIDIVMFSDNVINAYRNFRDDIKRELFIRPTL